MGGTAAVLYEVGLLPQVERMNLVIKWYLADKPHWVGAHDLLDTLPYMLHGLWVKKAII